MWNSRSALSPRKSVMEGRPRSSDMVVTTPAGLLSARYTRSWRLGMRLAATLMTRRAAIAPRAVPPQDPPVALAPPLADQLLTPSAAADTGGGKHLLQADAAGDVDE